MSDSDLRGNIIKFVKQEMMGPFAGDKEELVNERPDFRYVSGIIFPAKKVSSFKDETNTDDEISMEESETSFEESIVESNQSVEEMKKQEQDVALNPAHSLQTSSMGITFSTENIRDVSIHVSCGVYQLSIKDENRIYTRIPIIADPVFDSFDENKKVWEQDVYNANGLILSVRVIRRKEHPETGFGIYTIVLINRSASLSGRRTAEALSLRCFYQVELVLESNSSFSPVDYYQAYGGDADAKANSFLFRDKRNFAIGHNCAVSWDDQSQENPKCLKSSFFPEYEIPSSGFMHQQLKENLEKHGKKKVAFSMKYYADEAIPFESKAETLRLIISSYREWIETKFSDIDRLDNVSFIAEASKNKNDCIEVARRANEGIEILLENSKARKAFMLMNQAMLMQQLHYNLPLLGEESIEEGGLQTNRLSKKFGEQKIRINNAYVHTIQVENEATWDPAQTGKILGQWRPFQLVFILMNILSLTDKKSEERKLVDLIWFATGGGKTEAYLGLSAFTIFYRRLIDRNDSGTTVIMRYTLRMLSSQQFLRAGALICACELIRKDHQEELGVERITSGFFVGGDTSPNTNKEAKSKLDELNSYPESNNPFIVNKCPWCGAPLGAIDHNGEKHVLGYAGDTSTGVSFVCPNEQCDFSKKRYPLPLFVVDEQIFDTRPTLIVGTVDKFASMPTNEKTGFLLGVDPQSNASRPDLIIQDELHLISGPLGSTVGLYESLFMSLTHKDGVGPKIIASTATISHAAEQCNGLYGVDGQSVKQFPPSGMDFRDNFFSFEASPCGRRYIGVNSSSKSNVVTSQRLYAALLVAAQCFEDSFAEQVDSYWTTVGYYGSLREIGQAVSWASSEILERYQYVLEKAKSIGLVPGNKARRKPEETLLELTSRIKNPTAELKKLEQKYTENNNSAVDLCFSTNMISVGVDVSRLGLMVIVGQPKTTSEYIQASSRVGRGKNKGLVFTVYSNLRPRDKSQFEHFQEYHAKIYSHVEPTSVTPFSEPLMRRALHAVAIGLYRYSQIEKNNGTDQFSQPTKAEMDSVINTIVKRIQLIDPEEECEARKILEDLFKTWRGSGKYNKYYSFKAVDGSLMTSMTTDEKKGSFKNQNKSDSFEVMSSMRSVDGIARLGLKRFVETEDEEENDNEQE